MKDSHISVFLSLEDRIEEGALYNGIGKYVTYIFGSVFMHVIYNINIIFQLG